MKALLVGIAFTLFLLGGQASSEENLFIYNWTDYTAPALIKKFEAETGIKVFVDTYDSNETLLAKMKSGTTGYDIVVASSDFVPIFIAEKLIQQVDAATFPDYRNIEARWRSPAWDKDNRYTVPFAWGVTGFAVNAQHVPNASRSLATLFDPPANARGHVGMLSAPSEVVSMAELFLGLPPCQTDPAAMKKVEAVLEAQAPAVKIYASDGIIERLASGETWIQQTWNGDAARARAQNPAVRFIFPEQGAIAWMDNIAIPVGAKDPENARRFMQFMLQPQNAALSANFTHYSSAISGTERYLDASMRDAPELKVPANEVLSFTPSCPQEATRLIDRVWTHLRR